jgi:hypothetical protein
MVKLTEHRSRIGRSSKFKAANKRRLDGAGIEVQASHALLTYLLTELSLS